MRFNKLQFRLEQKSQLFLIFNNLKQGHDLFLIILLQQCKLKLWCSSLLLDVLILSDTRPTTNAYKYKKTNLTETFFGLHALIPLTISINLRTINLIMILDPSIWGGEEGM